MSQILWQPGQDQIEASNLTGLMDLLARKHGAAATDPAVHGLNLANYPANFDQFDRVNLRRGRAPAYKPVRRK